MKELKRFHEIYRIEAAAGLKGISGKIANHAC